jgi:hypothetical protein
MFSHVKLFNIILIPPKLPPSHYTSILDLNWLMIIIKLINIRSMKRDQKTTAESARALQVLM